MKFTKIMRGSVMVCVLTMAGCGVSGVSDSGNTANISDFQKPDNTAKDSNGDSLIRSATMQGSVAAFSDNGCTVSPVTNVDENTAAVAAPGSEDDATNVAVSYKEDCIFQIADINITTGKAAISDASVSDIKKQASLLIYGAFEGTRHLTAEKIIITRYE